MISRTHIRLLILAFAWALLMALAGVAGVAGAQEGDDPLTRYDSRTTAALAEAYEQNQQRAEQIEDEIEAATDSGDWDRRSELHDELYDMPPETPQANALGDARLADTEASPLPSGSTEKAVELRRKAQSLDAQTAWAASAPLSIDSRLYGLLGKGDAEALARTYRREAGALEVAAGSEEAAEEAAPEPEPVEEETPGAAPGAGEGGGEKPVEKPEASPEAPPVETGDAGGFLGSVNPVPILAFALLVGAAIFALSRSAGVSVGKFFSPAMAEVSKKRKPAPKKTAPKKPEKVVTSTKTRTSTPEDEPRPEPETRPEPDTEPEPLDSKALQEWFEKEAPTPKPDPRDEGDAAADDEEPPD